MPVLRQVHRENFTVLPNELLQDPQLSCRDRGLLVLMLSKPPEWVFSHKSLLGELPLDTKGGIQGSVNKLRQLGYLQIIQERHRGQLGKTVWYISDTPYPNMQDTAGAPPPYPEIPGSGKPAPYKIHREKSAAPALEGGVQPGCFFDKTAGTWKRRDVP